MPADFERREQCGAASADARGAAPARVQNRYGFFGADFRFQKGSDARCSAVKTLYGEL